MTFLQRFWRTELISFAALIVSGALIAIYGFVDSFRAGTTSLITPSGALWISFAYTVSIGALPIILYGAPIYALLAHMRRASWPAVIAVGIAPGALAFPFEASLGGWALGCGAVVASITHFLMQHWERRSNRVLESDAQQETLRAPHHGR